MIRKKKNILFVNNLQRTRHNRKYERDFKINMLKLKNGLETVRRKEIIQKEQKY